MKNKLKSIFKFLCVTSPIAILGISCGGISQGEDLTHTQKKDIQGIQLEEEKKVVENAKDTKIKVAVRASDLNVYKGLADKFNSFDKGKVEIESLPELDMIEALQTKEATGSLPQAFLVDMSTMGEIVEKSVFAKPIILEEFMKEENKDLYNVEDNQSSYKLSDFEESAVKFSSNKNGIQYAAPLGYSSTGIILNDAMLDHEKEIHSYVPINMTDAETDDERATGTTLLKDQNGQPISYGKATIENIQKYIDGAGISTNIPDPNQNWLGHGIGNLFQRIYSVGRSAMKGDNPSATIMPWKEMYQWFPLWATSQENKSVLQNNVITKENFRKMLTKDKKATEELARYFWNAFGGYTYKNANYGGFVSSDSINPSNAQGEAEPFMEKRALLLVIAKWAENFVDSNWSKNVGPMNFQNFTDDDKSHFNDNEGVSSGQIKVLSLPYSPVSVADAMGISHTASPVETLVAKRFIKFLFNNNKSDALKVSIEQPTSSGGKTLEGSSSENSFLKIHIFKFKNSRRTKKE